MLRQELADMPRQQSKTLDALLRLNGAAAPTEISNYSRLPLNVVTTQLGRLKAARYVTLEGGGKGRKATYRVADQMFSVWYWMRYVPVARRRIELFIDFLRAWFSLEERKRLFRERWERFHACQSRGLVGMAGQSLRDAEYRAASLDDPTERKMEMERIADAYVTTGDWPSAAGLFAELAGSKVKSITKLESLGYSVLASRLEEKGDLEGAVRSYSDALAKGPPNVGMRANLGLCLARTGRYAEAKDQFDHVLKKPRLSVALRSAILLSRSVAKGQLRDPQGMIADCTAATEIEGAPAKGVATALIIRGAIKSQLGDPQGAIADYTAAVELNGAPAQEVALAHAMRGSAHSDLGQHGEALGDFTLSLELPGLPEEFLIPTIYDRGVAREKVGKPEGSLVDYAQCAQSGILPSVHEALEATVRLLLSEKRVDEALAWARRFHELEPREASLNTRLEARLDMIRAASRVASREDTSRLVDALLESDPEELRARLQFLKPGLELAKTHDESVLAKLPEEERKMAREIARSLAEAAHKPVGQPPP
jgi:tetratricopeptide (TPR) repeat protein